MPTANNRNFIQIVSDQMQNRVSPVLEPYAIKTYKPCTTDEVIVLIMSSKVNPIAQAPQIAATMKILEAEVYRLLVNVDRLVNMNVAYTLSHTHVVVTVTVIQIA